MKIAIIGAGWAGLAAAVEATRAGHHVTVLEAARTPGGRARAVPATLPDGTAVTLDNGQHILLGAYRETLRLLHLLGVATETALLRRPMTLRFADGSGLRLPAWPRPLNFLAAIVTARGWTWSDRISLLRAASQWRGDKFNCDPGRSVAQLCQALSPRVMADLIAPLCLSALNTEVSHASAQVFLRVLHDALLGARGDSDLLLPRIDLSELFPHAAASWLRQHSVELRLGTRVQAVRAHGPRWQIEGETFDAIVLATPVSESVRMLRHSPAVNPVAQQIAHWAQTAGALRFQAITTVYAWHPDARLAEPMLALRSGTGHQTGASAQFVFDRGQLGGPGGLLAFVISASTAERDTLQAQVLLQAQQQLGLRLQAVQTLVERRATFACTPGLQRPARHIAAGLYACGDYVAGPYPATLEGAVRSGVTAARAVPLDVYDATSKPNKEPDR